MKNGAFAVLYKDKPSRPNNAINILVNLGALKVEFGWSNEGIYDSYNYNVQVRYVLGQHELIEEDFNFRTEYNFRRRLNQYRQEHGIKLLHVSFYQVTDEKLDLQDQNGQATHACACASVDDGNGLKYFLSDRLGSMLVVLDDCRGKIKCMGFRK